MNVSISFGRGTIYTVCGFLSQFVFGAAATAIFALTQPAGEAQSFALLVGLSLTVTANLFVRLVLALAIALLCRRFCSTTRSGMASVLALNALVMVGCLAVARFSA